MRTDEVKYTSAQRKQMKKDRQRLFRVVERFDFSGIVDKSPVQIEDGFVIADIETNELFACLIFQNLSYKYIRSLSIRLLLYSNMNIPYDKVYFTYSSDNATFGIREMAGEEKHFFNKKKYPHDIRPLEYFGNCAYIKLPESYFKRIEVELLSATFSNLSKQELDIVVTSKVKRISSLNDDQQYAFYHLNIYRDAESAHPTLNIPQEGDSVWLCCCGHKNLNTESICSLCKRDREWQMKTIDEFSLDSKVTELLRESDVMLRHKDNFKGYTANLSLEEQQKKIEDYERVIRNVAEQERKKEKEKMLIIPKILFFFGVVLLLIYFLEQI